MGEVVSKKLKALVNELTTKSAVYVYLYFASQQEGDHHFVLEVDPATHKLRIYQAYVGLFTLKQWLTSDDTGSPSLETSKAFSGKMQWISIDDYMNAFITFLSGFDGSNERWDCRSQKVMDEACKMSILLYSDVPDKTLTKSSLTGIKTYVVEVEDWVCQANARALLLQTLKPAEIA